MCNTQADTLEAPQCVTIKVEVSLSCGGGGLRISLCPDRQVNTDQRLCLNRLACYHVYHSPLPVSEGLHTVLYDGTAATGVKKKVAVREQSAGDDCNKLK